MKDYPTWICHKCGDKFGRRACGVSTWHVDICGICGDSTMVTEPSDFGFLKDGWDKHTNDALVKGTPQ